VRHHHMKVKPIPVFTDFLTMKETLTTSMPGKKMSNGEAGFSLIELLIVVMIIGILVSIATVSYVFVITRSKETACKANRKILETAIHEYLSKESRCPQNLEELFPDYIDDRDNFRCPASEVPYEYTTNASRSEYTLNCPNCDG
jgi:general secretion pathway protein G